LRAELESYVDGMFHQSTSLARAALHHFNRQSPDLEQHDVPLLIDAAVRLRYLSWPRKLRYRVQGRSLADIGCGTGLHGIGFVVVGVTRYVGVDPRIDPGRDRFKDLRSGRWVNIGWSAADIMRLMPRIQLFSGGVEHLPEDACFDVAVMHNVTEHLADLEGVLAATVRHLKPGGEIIFNHHNFFCWNGHHLRPKRVSDIDPDDAEQKKYLDWGHLDYDAPPEHYLERGLNKIRISQLKALTERYFDLQQWDLVPSDYEQGAGRLTPEVRARHPELTDVDFTTQNVFCRASPRPEFLSERCSHAK
jgi:SAM-dependent methyltransferase